MTDKELQQKEPKINILYVDDESDLLMIAKIFLERTGTYRVDTLTSAKKALESSLLHTYDAIVSDFLMPGMDGISFLERLRAIEFESGIVLGDGVPVIMITAYEKPFLTAFNKGCDDYLLKPVDPDELIKRIQSHLRSDR